MVTRRPRRGGPADGAAGDPGAAARIAVEPVFAEQRAALQQLLGDAGRLHHALLLTGRPGIGKRAAAAAIARALLCETPPERRPDPALACATCPSCQWVASASHPDIRQVSLLAKDDGKLASDIGIDQIRELEPFVGMTAFRGGRRVILIDPADRLNTASANALLKMLEEPGPATTFLLVCDRPEALPATVRSRCRRVELPAPAAAGALQWLMAETGLPGAEAEAVLAASGGAPLHARDLAETARQAAHRSLLEAIAGLPETATIVAADRVGTAMPVDWYPVLQRWVADLLRVSSGGRPRFYPGSAARLAELARRTSLAEVATMAAVLQGRAALVRHPLNARLFLEESLAIYRDAVDNRRGG